MQCRRKLYRTYVITVIIVFELLIEIEQRRRTVVGVVVVAFQR